MPRRSILSAADRVRIYEVPSKISDLVKVYGFSEEDLAIINNHRGEANRLGFAVQLAYMRYPGISLPTSQAPDRQVLDVVADQVGVNPAAWVNYAGRAPTRREHRSELQKRFGYRTFTLDDRPNAVAAVSEIAQRTDTSELLINAFVEHCTASRTLLPPFGVIELVCGEAITKADRHLRDVVNNALTAENRARLDGLLVNRDGSTASWISWLRTPPGKPNSAQILKHLDRLEHFHNVGLPPGIERPFHQNRLLKIAREGSQMPASDLRRLDPLRRHLTLVAITIESTATITDEIIDMHDKIVTKTLAAARIKHKDQFHASGKAINDKVKLLATVGEALVTARDNGSDPFAAVEDVIEWDKFVDSVQEAAALARPTSFDFLVHVGDRYATIHRYSTRLCTVLNFKASPAAASLIAGIELLGDVQRRRLRHIPTDAPTGFVNARWSKFVITPEGIDRRFYELCAMSELKNSLRAGDVAVHGSRQFKDFDDYLLPTKTYATYAKIDRLGISIDTDCDQYLQRRLGLLEEQLDIVDKAVSNAKLEGVTINANGLTISPQPTIVPSEAKTLAAQTQALMPRIRITDLLAEVEQWTGFSRHFTNLKTGNQPTDINLLLTAILADGLNLGLTKMAESCPTVTHAKLARLHAWHIRDDTYRKGLADVVDAQHRREFTNHWGDGTTAASDGQRFQVGDRAKHTGHVNLKYGVSPGRMLYTHISDKYAPFHSTLINVGVRESTFVLDGLLYHESDLRVAQHYTDTNGFTDHVFGLTQLLGFRFVPRIRDLADSRMHTLSRSKHPHLAPLIGTPINVNAIKENWDNLMRLASSISHGTVTASLMLGKLGSYPRQNGLAIALREFGKIERTLAYLNWLQDPALRRQTTAGLNKGESRQSLARAVFFHRLGEIRDRSFEHQHNRSSGLNLLTAAIVLWNTVYLEQAVTHLQHRSEIDPTLLQHLSPLGWAHINLTGDYTWGRPRSSTELRPLTLN